MQHTGPSKQNLFNVAFLMRRLGCGILPLLLLAVGTVVQAQEDEGYFEVRSASAELVSDVYFLNA